MITVVIPAYNEAESIGDVLDDIQRTCGDLVQETIVVDDGSRDQTREIASKHGARVLIHKRNRGYGAALKTGILAAQTPYVLTMDSDGQHGASDIRTLWEHREEADMVVGQRTSLIHSPLWRMPGKWVLGWLANYISRRTIPDLNSGMRLMRTDVVRKYLHLCPSGFSFSTTITLTLLNRQYSVEYWPITIRPRVGKSTVSVRTGLDTIILILRIAMLFDPLRVFLPLSLFTLLIGILWGIPYLLAGYGVSVGAMLAIVLGVLLFGIGLLADQISQMRLERME